MPNQLVATLNLSSEAPGVRVDANGSRMTLDLSPSLNVPPGSTCRLLRASLWYDSPNITVDMPGGNKVTFAEQPGGVVRAITIPEGLYGLNDLTETLGELLINAGSAYVIRLVGDSATGKVSLQAYDPTGTSTSLSWNYDIDNGVMRLLGFSGSQVILPNVWQDGLNRASLNQLNGYVLHSSFCGGSNNIFGGEGGSTALDSVLISSPAGSQIRHEPANPIEIPVLEGRLDRIEIWVTAEDGTTPIKTNEPITLLLEIRRPQEFPSFK